MLINQWVLPLKSSQNTFSPHWKAFHRKMLSFGKLNLRKLSTHSLFSYNWHITRKSVRRDSEYVKTWFYWRFSESIKQDRQSSKTHSKDILIPFAEDSNQSFTYGQPLHFQLFKNSSFGLILDARGLMLFELPVIALS